MFYELIFALFSEVKEWPCFYIVAYFFFSLIVDELCIWFLVREGLSGLQGLGCPSWLEPQFELWQTSYQSMIYGPRVSAKSCLVESWLWVKHFKFMRKRLWNILVNYPFLSWIYSAYSCLYLLLIHDLTWQNMPPRRANAYRNDNNPPQPIDPLNETMSYVSFGWPFRC